MKRQNVEKIYWRRKNIIALLMFIILVLILFVIFPLFYELCPRIENINVLELERVTILEDNSFIILYGDDIDEIDTLYVNGEVVPYVVASDVKMT